MIFIKKWYQWRTIAYTTTILFIIFRVNAQNPKDILARYLDTVSYGDVEKWKEVRSLYAESIGYFNAEEFVSGTASFSEPTYSYKKLFRLWPDHHKEELYSDSLFQNVTSRFFFLKDRHVIFIGNMPPITSEVKRHVWFDFYPVKIADYIKNSKKIVYMGVAKVPNEDIDCHEIHIITKDKIHRLLINTETYLLEGILMLEENFFTRVSDYKDFEGYLIPTYVAGIRGASIFQALRYRRITINKEIDPKIFVP